MIEIANRRLIIAHNPHSSRADAVKRQVFDRLDAASYAYATIEVQQAPLEDNVARLAPLIQANDIILSAAGDGSAHAVIHTVLAAKQPGVELGFLAYGNFNDIPHVLNSKDTLHDPVAFLEKAKTRQAWPLIASVDGKPLRGALLYATIGWTAKAASYFDDPNVRHKITHGGAGRVKSIWRTGVYYLKTRNSSTLPRFRINETLYEHSTDALFINSPLYAGMFHTGKDYYRQEVFLFRVLDVRSIIRNAPFLFSSLIGHMGGREEKHTALEFDSPASIPIQCDGEVVQLTGVTRIEISKTNVPLNILGTR